MDSNKEKQRGMDDSYSLDKARRERELLTNIHKKINEKISAAGNPLLECSELLAFERFSDAELVYMMTCISARLHIRLNQTFTPQPHQAG